MSTPGWLEGVTWQRVSLWVAIFVGGTGAGAGFAGALDIPQRVSAIENWRGSHADTLADVIVPRIEATERATRALDDRTATMAEQVEALFCDRWPEECTLRPGFGR